MLCYVFSDFICPLSWVHMKTLRKFKKKKLLFFNLQSGSEGHVNYCYDFTFVVIRSHLDLCLRNYCTNSTILDKNITWIVNNKVFVFVCYRNNQYTDPYWKYVNSLHIFRICWSDGIHTANEWSLNNYSLMIDWLCFTPTLALFHFYRVVNKIYELMSSTTRPF